MSTSDDTGTRRPGEVVRLKIDGMTTTVNTIKEQETGQGISLVCPFPALEVDIPASFGAQGEMTFGAVHRIGVEDDPETGLPRLRLQIRTRDTRETVADDSTRMLLAKANIEDVAVKEAESENDSVAEDGDLPEEEPETIDVFDFKQDFEMGRLFEQTDIFYGVPPHPGDHEEPEWVGCDDLPDPREFQSRQKTRRRYKVVKLAVIAFVVGMVAATGYTLKRAGIVDFANMKDRIASISSVDETVVLENTAAVVPLMPTPQEKAILVKAALEEPIETLPAAEPAAAETVAQDPNSPTVEVASYAQVDDTQAVGPEAVAVEDESADPDQGADDASGEVVITLPTKWPVEYSTAYRIRDPNGVVVDVPGGLVRREGWLDWVDKYPMVRSIKSIQRESGARFIVYVNGELPNFMTSPKAGGVGLRLYFDKTDKKGSTVASLTSTR